MRVFRFILTLVAALAAGGLVRGLVMDNDPDDAFAWDLGVDEEARAAVEEQLGRAVEHRAFFVAFRQGFSGDYETVVTQFSRRAQETGRLDAPERYVAESLRALRRSKGLLAAQADDDRLARVFATQKALLDAMGETDAHLCVEFLFGHAGRAYDAFAARHRQLVARMAHAQIEAMVEGRARRIVRRAPDAGDFALLERALQERGLDQAAIETLLDGKPPPAPTPDTVLCRAGRVYHETLRALPDDVRLRIYGLAVEALARS